MLQPVAGVPKAAFDLRAFLAGRWRLTRQVGDRRSGQAGRMDGEAVFVPVATGLRYKERGRLRLGAYEGSASRVYLFEFPAPTVAEVRFQDGHLFHRVDLASGRGSAAHRCAGDHYEGHYIIADEDCWATVWRVSGPRKRFVLRTRYLRLR